MQLDLSRYHPFLKITRQGKDRLIFDPIRKKYLVIQPEELVRQSWIEWLMREKSIGSSSLSVEKQMNPRQGPRRFDLVLYRKAKPWMLFEFKSFRVTLTDNVCMQAAAYNLELHVPYILLSNGMEHRLFSIDFKNRKVSQLSEWPKD